MAFVEIYTKAYCPYCVRAKSLLASKNIEFKEYPVDREPALRDEMITRANGGYTVPQIFINQKHIGGCDDMMALEQQQSLDKLLAQSS